MTTSKMLDVNGTLSTLEANELCNRIAMYIKPIDDELESIQSHTVVINDKKNDNNSRVENIAEMIKNKCELKSVLKYLYKALAEYNKIAEKNHNDMVSCLRDAKKEYEDDAEEISEELKPIESFEDYISTLKLEDVIKFKEAEAHAAHLGKFIHNFDRVRESLISKKLIDFKAIGDTVVKFNNKPLYTTDELQGIQDNLIARHRDYENTVNYYKAMFNKYTNEANLKYEKEVARLNEKAVAEIGKLKDEKQQNIENEREEIRQLKIVVPAEYKKIIDTLELN